jgi:hypothetical protein
MISRRSTGFDIGVCLGLSLGLLSQAKWLVELVTSSYGHLSKLHLANPVEIVSCYVPHIT